MADQQGSDHPLHDPAEFARAWFDITERSHRLMCEWLSRQDLITPQGPGSPAAIAGSFAHLTGRLIADPTHLARAQVSLWTGFMELWQNTTLRMIGFDAEPLYQPGARDRRFQHPAWRENEIFNYIKQSYLLVSRWLDRTVHDVTGLDPRCQQKVEFYTRQFISAVSPSNFALTNPEVLAATMESCGENLINGLRNLLADLERGHGALRIRQSDPAGFRVGETVAATPGAVIFRNRVMELIQYAPVTETVLRRPLLFVPPWINKYYLFDLGERSWVRWAVAQGHTVFMISWVNPGSALADLGFEDYVREGPLAALEAIRAVTGEQAVDAVGYCVGGTLLAAAAAWLAARGERRFASLSLFASLLDFSEPGDLGVFIDEATISSLEDRMSRYGHLPAGELELVFNLLRENDLIWSFVVNNYLLGRDPFPFDLLSWNADSTRMPFALHQFYLRNLFQQNRLATPNALALDGCLVDLGRIDAPLYVLAARQDHIAPWRSAYKSVHLLAGPARFVLTDSGHVAGVVNPPESGKYGYHAQPMAKARPPAQSAAWYQRSRRNDGSWWPDWHAWVVQTHGNREQVAPRIPGEGGLPVLEPAPGRYVRMSADDGDAE
ncbi:MAG: class I poly(R)-hydroxyalkanoic acid synthase [Rhodospirillales bacterium]|nr:MAG: class I poly(R)-hydroxyalkanoic acid synthase [Rhodospirillales bacterium]